MTAIVWGDPLSGRYSWVEPADLADHGDAVGHVAGKVGAATRSLETMATLPEFVLAGATAEAVRSRADDRATDAIALRSSLREVARAIHDHADMLRGYRDALGGLLRLATERGLEVRDRTIWPPDAAPVPSPTQQQYDAWIAAWKAYRACFDLKMEIEAERRAQTHELARAMTTHTGARPRAADEQEVEPGHGAVGVGRGRGESTEPHHRAADRALRTLQIHEELESTQDQVARLREVHRSALDELHRLGRTGATDDQLTAAARDVRLAAEALRAERAQATSLQAELVERIS